MVSDLKSPPLMACSAGLFSFTPLAVGHSLLPLAKWSCACGLARYSRNLTAAAGFLAWRATAPPAMFTWVPQLFWLGNTMPTFPISVRSLGSFERMRRAM
jgi:hypothetical protein